jgi:ribosomal protein S27AE
MSMLDNLENIKKFGIREFVKQEKARWACGKCGGILSTHRDACLYCGQQRPD